MSFCPPFWGSVAFGPGFHGQVALMRMEIPEYLP
jgi:hypothetical protein